MTEDTQEALEQAERKLMQARQIARVAPYEACGWVATIIRQAKAELALATLRHADADD